MVPGPHNFCGAPVDQPAPTKFGTKAVIVTYSPNPRCVPNLKLLASMVSEINRGSQTFGDTPLTCPLPISVLKLFWQATPRTKVVAYKISL